MLLDDVLLRRQSANADWLTAPITNLYVPSSNRFLEKIQQDIVTFCYSESSPERGRRNSCVVGRFNPAASIRRARFVYFGSH
jgi:hypothetical protein